MIITTTNSIENAKVVKYLGVVTTNLVIGTDFFSDLMASFADIFGGMAGTYHRHMDELYQKAYDSLTIKASMLGANAVLGFKIDFDEISGKGMQMFMISVSGTAVCIKMEEDLLDDYECHCTSVSAADVEIELFKSKWKNRNENITPRANEINYIIENRLWDLVPSLYAYYVQYNSFSEARPIDIKFPAIMSLLSYELAIKFIYDDYSEYWLYAFPLIRDYKLFCAEKVLEILEDGHIDLAIELLQTAKMNYTIEDVRSMKAIVEYLDNLPDKGQIAEVKAGPFSSKLVEMYQCPSRHKNEKQIEFCEVCGQNIKGLRQSQVEIISAFKDRVNIIEKMLGSNL